MRRANLLTSKCFSNLFGHVLSGLHKLGRVLWKGLCIENKQKTVTSLILSAAGSCNVLGTLGEDCISLEKHFSFSEMGPSPDRPETKWGGSTSSIHSVSTREISTVNLFIQEPFNVNFMNETNIEKWEETRYALEITLSTGQYWSSCGKT